MKKILKSCRSVFLFLIALTISSIPSPNASAQYTSISLDHTVGQLLNTDSIACDQPIEFHIRASNYTDYNIYAVYGVFQVYSTDNAIWAPIVLDTVPLLNWQDMFDLLTVFDDFSVIGSGADTVCFAGAQIFGGGFPPGFDSVSWIISTSVDCTEEGKTICLDSVTSALFSCEWVWYTPGVGDIIPNWDGPHCFTISKCCVGLRGDSNNDGEDANILDLTFLVDFIFRGGIAAACPAEADLNGDGDSSNILDLTFLVDFIFRGGTAPGACS